MTSRRALLVPLLGLIVGVAIGFVDSRPGWDDTGITVGALFLASAILGAVRPRLFLVTGLAIGVPVFAWNVLLRWNYGSALAIVVSLVGAGIGSALGRLGSSDGNSRLPI